MSETTEPGTPPAEPTPAPTPSPESTAAPASDTTRDTTEAPEQTEEQKAEQQEGRRVAQLRARMGAKERENERLAQENEYLRRVAQGQPQAEETPEQRYQRERQAIRGEVEAQIRAETFHRDGESAFPDWGRKCADLMELGADAQFASLLIEMPDGVRIAGALADDPEAVQRIANIRSERGRAIALGKYAATVENGGGGGGNNGHTQRVAPVTRAPAPIRPVTGRASPQVNEYSMNATQLAEFYAKRDMDNRLRR